MMWLSKYYFKRYTSIIHILDTAIKTVLKIYSKKFYILQMSAFVNILFTALLNNKYTRICYSIQYHD